MNNSDLYLCVKSLKDKILIHSEEYEIFTAFNHKGQLITFCDTNCFNHNYIIYASTLKSLYILLQTTLYKEVDFLIIQIISNRILRNISSLEISKYLDISLDKYIEIEEGKRQLKLNQRKVICEKLKITTFSIDEFMSMYFKRVN